MKTKLGKESDSIWKMNKAELVELARRELGITLMAANAETVLVLRERIRAQREMLKTVVDPYDQVPKGLEKLKLEELKLEVQNRNLPLPEKPTRARLILLIRDDVTARNTLFASPTVPTQNRSGGPASTTDRDWNMEDRPVMGRKR